jgi:hypothetical protein
MLVKKGTFAKLKKVASSEFIYNRKEVIEILTHKHVDDFYPNPDPDGSDFDKSLPEIKKWLDEFESQKIKKNKKV